MTLRLVGDAIVGASEALDVDDELDPDALPEPSYWSDIGEALDAEYARGAAAIIAHRFSFDA